ncbi:DUF3073 domain-containing protein [Tomitella cavernea]|uniref:DUF3073 domain-containing protein n=1 Tax=Tomitella cavernea TaxID=1387982 RepID=A0ABP9CFA7_9ACTN|nr:DUF3073 domain-containing protein [Tomitella cavernea]
MGRGRAKAKQTKVARKLKYSSPTTDFESLQQELSTSSPSGGDLLEDDRSEQDAGSAWGDDHDEWRR